MNFLKLLLLAFLIGSLSSCAVEPVPIDYGKDACHFCNMNIVDQQHAAEIVTDKGKAFKFDALECMMRDITKRNEEEIAHFLMTDYLTPGKLVDATKATYLISEAIPSPMGANLTGFESNEKAVETQQEKGGTVYSWDSLKELFEER